MGLFGSSNNASGDDEGLRRRVEELERRVAALEWGARNAGQSGVVPVAQSPQSGVSAEVRQLALQGQRIQAIKVLRDQTGMGLREAKDIVDRL
ncbi:ribosomal protein L7/L12 [Mycolicibacterium komossense]|uniref:Ribosomal protein L7/L12 n=1 Tax=Mycolicibacterium komossense TaxID=1779 RepID=A0ABT3CK32_9MYCO|nr:ribosomal protein L7/L12 [Mycolicibacterium komossense]MCV7229796.1 ribosomal protein L7/L12 [Mycolicibacterium komossense]